MQTLCVSFSIIFSTLSNTFGTPIVNGFSKPAEPNLGQFPFHASLMQLANDKKSYHSFCGGSLIHPSWILTAAHCIQLDENTSTINPNDLFVALGSILRNADKAQIIRAARAVVHPSYLKTGGHSDIGLIKLKQSARLGRNVKTITLHTKPRELFLGQTAYLTGFGIINDLYQTPVRLRKATLHVTTHDKCYNAAQYKNTEICAASTVAEGKACKGDSGGPLFVVRNGKNVQIGVTSRLALLPVCRVSFNNSIYTRASAFIAWISQITRVDFMKYNQNNSLRFLLIVFQQLFNICG